MIEDYPALEHACHAFEVTTLTPNQLPDGWNALATEMRTVCTWAQIQPTTITIEKGLLRFRFEKTTAWNSIIVNRYAQIIARASCNTCIVCGKWGVRRKQEEHWPVLCQRHYVSYVNMLDQLRGDDAV